MERLRKSLRELVFVAFIASIASAHAQTTMNEEGSDSQQTTDVSPDLPPPPPPELGGMGMMGGGPRGGGFLQHAGAMLNLTADQQTQISTIESNYRTEVQTAEQAMHQAMKNLETAINLSTFDEAAIRTAAAAQGSALAEVSVVRGQIQSQINALLTDEQKQQLENMHNARQNRRRHAGF